MCAMSLPRIAPLASVAVAVASLLAGCHGSAGADRVSQRVRYVERGRDAIGHPDSDRDSGTADCRRQPASDRLLGRRAQQRAATRMASCTFAQPRPDRSASSRG